MSRLKLFHLFFLGGGKIYDGRRQRIVFAFLAATSQMIMPRSGEVWAEDSCPGSSNYVINSRQGSIKLVAAGLKLRVAFSVNCDTRWDFSVWTFWCCSSYGPQMTLKKGILCGLSQLHGKHKRDSFQASSFCSIIKCTIQSNTLLEQNVDYLEILLIHDIYMGMDKIIEQCRFYSYISMTYYIKNIDPNLIMGVYIHIR